MSVLPETATELRRAFASGELSPVEVMEDTLARAEHEGALLNAFITVDGERAMAAARVAESALREPSANDRPLLGIPVSVKDLTATAGLRTTRGSLISADQVPSIDAPAVARIRNAGGIIFAKTNTAEGGWKADAGNRLIGPTASPWNQAFSSGGSSGGAAAAVAAGIGPLATGTDGAGSVRIPAAFCGVVGFKPTVGVIAYMPASADQLSHIGPITRTVEDAALLASVMLGADDCDPYSVKVEPTVFRSAPVAQGKLRIGVSYDLGFANPADEIVAATQSMAASLADAGHIVEELGVGINDPYWIIDTLIASAEAADHEDDLEQVRPLLDPGHVEIIEHGREITGAMLARALRERTRVATELAALMSGYDVLLTPTLPLTGFKLGEDGPDGNADLAWTQFTYPFNLTGQPAISIPAGFTSDGLPLAVQLIGRRFDDALVLAAAAACERATPWSQAYPQLWSRLTQAARFQVTPSSATVPRIEE